jgi:PAS domain S-box-containing protein
MSKYSSHFFELSQDLLCVLDFNGYLIEANTAWSELLGWKISEVVGQHYRQFIHADDLPQAQKNIEMTLAKTLSQSNQFTCRVLHRNKSFRWVNWDATTDFENKIKYVVAKDITEKKIYEIELQRIFNNIPALIGYWSKNLKNIFANVAYAQYFNYLPDNIKDLELKTVLGEKLFQENSNYIMGVLAGEPQSFENEKFLSKGIYQSILVKYIPDFKDNEVIGFFVVATDITTIKKLEKERRDTESKLIASAKMSTLGEMAGGVAHEINNPLSIIYGKSGQMKRKIESGEIDISAIVKDLSKIETMADRISRIIKGLHSFSRDSNLDSIETHYLSQIIENTLELCNERFKHHSIDLRVTCPKELKLDCRPTQLSQVLINLLGNSFDAVEKLPERWVHLEADEQNQEICISITDSGLGIPANLREKIMQPFYTTKNIGKGTGLGLSISKGLIENHQGSLNYDPNCKNTRFVIKLPQFNISKKKRTA